MMKMLTLFISMLFIKASFTVPTSIKPKLTLDEYFDYSVYSSLSLSPTGTHILMESTRPSWKFETFESVLWLYNLQNGKRDLITKNPRGSIRPQWSPDGSWIAIFLSEPVQPSNETKSRLFSTSMEGDTEQFVYLYSIVTNDMLPIDIGKERPLAFAWCHRNVSFYLATVNSRHFIDDDEIRLNEEPWSDVRSYREYRNRHFSSLFHVELIQSQRYLSVKKEIIRNISFLISEMLYVPMKDELLLTSYSDIIEELHHFEIYSINFRKDNFMQRLTDNEVIEQNLKLSVDGESIIFQTVSVGSMNQGRFNDTQSRLYSINLVDRMITRIAEKFNGHVEDFEIANDGKIFILGQSGTEVHIYSQNMSNDEFVEHIGWNGTYKSISTSKVDSTIVFMFSSAEQPLEIYATEHIENLTLAKPLTSENKIFTQRDLPKVDVYQWKNADDNRLIEGILHYPPGKYRSKDLPVFVLLHGGPYSASLNEFNADWSNWATLAASEGWLVFEPNYRGSTGYGDGFLNEIRYRPLSLPGKDILFGIDQLIKDGIANPYKLTIGGYSFGGFLTNWLITQTKQFNAAVSGAADIDHISAWGTMDMPTLMTYLFGGFPWEIPHVFIRENPFYQLDRVRTPTIITTGEQDTRVPASQSVIFERALYHRGVPVKLITFPDEGHDLSENPWHGKIKVREELKWLQKYGHNRFYE